MIEDGRTGWQNYRAERRKDLVNLAAMYVATNPDKQIIFPDEQFAKEVMIRLQEFSPYFPKSYDR